MRKIKCIKVKIVKNKGSKAKEVLHDSKSLYLCTPFAQVVELVDTLL